MESQIYPIKPQLNKANTFDTEAFFSNLDLFITNDIVFELVNFSFLDECLLLPFLWCKHFATYSFVRVCSKLVTSTTKKPFF